MLFSSFYLPALIMARAAIRQLGQLFWIVGKECSMTVQTPAHAHDLGIFVNLLLGQVSVAILTVQSCCNVGPVRKVDKVRHLGNRGYSQFFENYVKIMIFLY
jgi:hypothetical protein